MFAAMNLPEFRACVEAHLSKTSEPPSTFGRRALGDPAWISRLRKGVEPKEATRARVLQAIKAYKPTKGLKNGKVQKRR